MSVDKLIEELAAGADLSAPKQFTLDREKAREKLRDHQLTDPRLYVLELLQAAVIRGATRVRFDVDADDLRMQFDGEPFDARDLDELYDAMWSSATDDRVRARKCLAVGFTSLMALKPRYVRLVSSDGEHGTRLELRPDAPDRLEPCRDAPAGTSIHVKARSRAQMVADFFRNMAGDGPEEALIRSRGRFCPVELDLEGDVVSQGLTLPDASITVDIAAESITGRGGLYPQDARPEFYLEAGGEDRRGYSSRLILLRDGVWITTHPLDLDPGCFIAVVDAPSLRKDASQHEFVRDEHYRRVLHAVQQAHLEAVAELARSRREGELPGVDPDWVDRSLHRVLARSFDRQAYERRDPVMRELALVPALRSVAGQPLSLQQIIDWWRTDGAVLYGSDAFPLLAAGAEKEELERVVQLKRRADEAICEKAFAGALRDADRAFEQRKKRAAERDRDGDVRPPPRLSPGNYLAQLPLPVDGSAQGEVGLLSGPSPESRVRFSQQGRTLETLEPACSVPGLVAELEADVRADGDTGGVRRDRRMGQALLAVYDALPATCAILARRQLGAYGSELEARDHRRHLLVQFLALWLDPEGSRRFLRECTVPDHIAEAVTAPRAAPPLPGEALATLPREITGLPLLATVGGEHRSLDDLQQRVEDQGRIAVVREAPTDCTPPAELADAVVAPADVRTLLTRLFDPTVLDDATAPLRRHSFRAAFERRPRQSLAAAGMVGVRVTSSRLEGAVGVRAAEPGATADGDSYLTVLLQGRVLSRDTVRYPLPALDGVILGDSRADKTQQRDLADPRLLAPYRRALFRGCAALLHALLDPETERLEPGPRRDLARRALAGLFGEPTWARCFLALRKEGAQDAAHRLTPLLDLGVAWPSGELDLAVSELLEEGQPITPTALGGRLPPLAVDPECGPVALTWDPSSSLKEPPLDWDALTDLDHTPPLVERLLSYPALIAALGDRWLTLQEVLGARSDHGRLLTVARHSTARAFPDSEPVLAVDPLDRRLLEALLGPHSLTDAEPLLARMATRASYLAQPALQRVELRSSEAVVRIRTDEDNTQGEIGLTRNHYGEATAELRLCLERRPVAVRRGFSPLGLVAVLNDERLTPDAAYDDVEDDAVVAQLIARCRDAVDPLFERLANHWAGLGSGDREVAWRHVLDYLVAHRPAAGVPGNALWRQLAGLTGFRGIGGRTHSWREVAQSAHARGQVEYLPYDVGSASTDPARPLLVASDHEVAQLRKVFDRVVDYSDAWYEEQEAQSRRQAAAALPRPPSRPLARQRLSDPGGGLEIDLWLDPLSTDPTRERVAFGRDGRTVQERPLSARYPCLGSVDGPAVEVDRGWTEATLSPAHTEAAVEVAVRLYRELLHRYEHEPEQLGTEPDAVRERLWQLCARLHRLRDELRLHERHLLSQLERLDLARLKSGDRLTLAAVLEARPAELTDLGLWAAEPKAAAAPVLQATAATTDEAALLEAIRALLRQLVVDAGELESAASRLSLGPLVSPLPAGAALPLMSPHDETVQMHEEHPLVAWALARQGQDPLAPALVVLRGLTPLAELLHTDETALLLSLVRRVRADGAGPTDPEETEESPDA